MDFFTIAEREAPGKKDTIEIYPAFRVMRSKDLMVRGKSFYAVWDEERGLWTTDEYDIQRLIDAKLAAYEPRTQGEYTFVRKFLGNFSTNSWLQYRNYVGHIDDSFTQLDSTVTFLNSEVTKQDYVSKRLPYDMASGDISAWDELVGTLYSPEERQKIEWVIGALVTGDSKLIQKCLVFYGSPGSGKGTIIQIIQELFAGYWEAFNAKELTGANNQFALGAFKANPLIGIDPDGDMSKISDNTKFNALVSHESIQINEKNKPLYTARFDTFLIMASNSPVKFTDSRSGLIRRVLDVHPTNKLLAPRKYQTLMTQIKFELGHIAHHCKEVYLSMGRDYYTGYLPVEMMLQTDVFFNFIEDNYDVFQRQDGVTLNQAWVMYQQFINDSGVEYKLPKYKLRDELKSYFKNFEETAEVNGERVKSYFSGFIADKFKSPTGKKEAQHMYSLVLDETESLLDTMLAGYPAQYSTDDGLPKLYWDNSVRMRFNEKTGENEEFTPTASQVVSTTLKDLNTRKEHYVNVDPHHIVVDFDLKGVDGEKSLERNLEAASSWPPTYAEISKSGSGVHLHYIYTGDPSELSSMYDQEIEIKVYTGNQALRRRLTLCNNIPVAEISSGLPIKEKKMIDEKQIEDEKHLRALINKALRKEIGPGTKSNIDFIHKILRDYHATGRVYDVTDLRNKIFTFAAMSTNQGLAAVKQVQTMQFASEDRIIQLEEAETQSGENLSRKEKATLNADSEVIFDVEVFPNLFLIVWGYKDAPREQNVVMVNPSPEEVGKLISMKLVGYNCRRYDNHMLYGAYMGYSNLQLYQLSKKIITNTPNALFREAFNLSYTDIFDFSSVKKSLKKWEIELGIHHLELGMDWDSPVPDDMVDKVIEYCQNDVEATKVVRKHLEGDFIARQILSDLSGLPMNATTQQHASRIVFGNDRNPQESFVYTDLSELFPGYTFDRGVSTYREEVTGEGGYVYAEPGVYANVLTLDITSMHPTSIEALNLFGEYTKKFSEIKEARVAIKRKDFEAAKQMLGGLLTRHLNDTSQAEALSYALKIVVNIVYGMTSAKFDNSFRDPRNIDNIVAKRGALFMIDLKHAVQEKGFRVVHIKTDSIKVVSPTQEIIDFILNFAREYGYEFEIEDNYAKFCLVNDAVFIAQKDDGKWTATGAQFQHPYVFKYLFSKEPITFNDLKEPRGAKTSIFIDYTGIDDTPMAFTTSMNDDFKRFVGKEGEFTPVEPGYGGGYLVRQDKDDPKKFSMVSGSKGYFWLESQVVKELKLEDHVDMVYFQKLVDAAVTQIKNHATDTYSYEWFVGS